MKWKKESHLLQMRGLKQRVRRGTLKKDRVASFTDAWIETVFYLPTEHLFESHLLQMRGLKLNNRRFDLECEESHLLQMRGLKRPF